MPHITAGFVLYLLNKSAKSRICARARFIDEGCLGLIQSSSWNGRGRKVFSTLSISATTSS